MPERASFVVLAALGLCATTLALVSGCANSMASCDGESPNPTYQCCATTAGSPAWIDVFNDPRNCGGCGMACAPGQFCRAGSCSGTPVTDGGGMPGVDGGPPGMCSPVCSSAQRCCGTSCIGRNGVAIGSDGRSDPTFMNCSACGNACDADRASACSVPGGGMGTPRCMCGVFDQCGAGQMCLRSGTDFQCVNLMTDVNNCGMPGHRCADGESCTSGMCGCGTTGVACMAGEACCSGGCIETGADEMNCGGCGVMCNPGETCNAGMCVCGEGPDARRCTAPMAGTFGMGGMPGESCCDGMCVANTDTNCGCGVMCDATMDETCQVGGDLFGMGGGAAEVCCGDEMVAFFGCGGGMSGADGGFPFP